VARPQDHCPYGAVANRVSQRVLGSAVFSGAVAVANLGPEQKIGSGTKNPRGCFQLENEDFEASDLSTFVVDLFDFLDFSDFLGFSAFFAAFFKAFFTARLAAFFAAFSAIFNILSCLDIWRIPRITSIEAQD
jgi:hypothetical protein